MEHGIIYNKVLKSENWRVIKDVIFPLKLLLDNVLITIHPSLYVSMLIQRHAGITRGFPLTKQVLEITPQTPYNKNLQQLFEYIIDTKHIEYCFFDNTGERYSFIVIFGKDSYKIMEKTFQYGTIPQQEEMEQIKNHIRKEISKYFI